MSEEWWKGWEVDGASRRPGSMPPCEKCGTAFELTPALHDHMAIRNETMVRVGPKTMRAHSYRPVRRQR